MNSNQILMNKIEMISIVSLLIIGAFILFLNKESVNKANEKILLEHRVKSLEYQMNLVEINERSRKKNSGNS